MKRFKKIFLLIFILFLIGTIGLITYFWPIDSRLCGKFQSDKEATIEYIKLKRHVTDRQLKIFNQIYGHSTLAFDGHKLNLSTISTIIHDYPQGSNTELKEGTKESFFVMIKLEKNRSMIIIFPSQFWKVNNFKMHELEFESNGFWLIENMSSTGREKFKQIKS